MSIQKRIDELVATSLWCFQEGVEGGVETINEARAALMSEIEARVAAALPSEQDLRQALKVASGFSVRGVRAQELAAGMLEYLRALPQADAILRGEEEGP